MTDDRNQQIRRRLQAAAPGPWRIQADQFDDLHWGTTRGAVIDTSDPEHPNLLAVAGMRHADADLIAHAPDDIAHLLHQVDQLRRAGWQLVDALTTCRTVTDEDSLHVVVRPATTLTLTDVIHAALDAWHNATKHP